MAESNVRSIKFPGGARGKPAQYAILIGGSLLAILFFFSYCTTYVAPNEVGILQSNFVPPTGIRPGLVQGGKVIEERLVGI